MGGVCDAFEEALDRYKQGRLTAEEAGELLGLSGRHFRRQCARYEADGVDGLRESGWAGVRRAVRQRANWRGCADCIARNMPTSPSSTSTRRCANGTATIWAIR
jgi:hypothetical protein